MVAVFVVYEVDKIGKVRLFKLTANMRPIRLRLAANWLGWVVIKKSIARGTVQKYLRIRLKR